jgi:hypothetical protein
MGALPSTLFLVCFQILGLLSNFNEIHMTGTGIRVRIPNVDLNPATVLKMKTNQHDS